MSAGSNDVTVENMGICCRWRRRRRMEKENVSYRD